MALLHTPRKNEPDQLNSNTNASTEVILKLARLLAQQAARELLSAPLSPTKEDDNGTNA